jgi:hypothetical protein
MVSVRQGLTKEEPATRLYAHDMNMNEISLTIKSASGGTWPDAEFNIREKVRQVLDQALKHFHLDHSLTYEVLVAGSRSLPLDESLHAAGVRDDDVLMVRSIGRPIDG